MKALPAYEHDCQGCEYLGTKYQIFPAMLGGDFHGMIPVGDFYRCQRALSKAYVCRGEAGVVEEDFAVLSDRSFVEIARGTGGHGFPLDDLKVVSLLDGMLRLDEGYAVVNLTDAPGQPYVVTSPLLLPHEAEILTRVAVTVIRAHAAPGAATPAGAVKRSIADALVEASNANGYVTRWNSGSLFSPPERGPESPENEVVG